MQDRHGRSLSHNGKMTTGPTRPLAGSHCSGLAGHSTPHSQGWSWKHSQRAWALTSQERPAIGTLATLVWTSLSSAEPWAWHGLCMRLRALPAGRPCLGSKQLWLITTHTPLHTFRGRADPGVDNNRAGGGEQGVQRASWSK